MEPKDKRHSLELPDRQEKIMELVAKQGFVSIQELAEQFSVTPQTSRRDVNKLSEMGLLQRHHGGATFKTSAENVAYAARRVMQLDEKKNIARLLSKYIPNAVSLFLNIGTTTEEVSKALLGHERLRVITNNLNIAQIMSQREGFEVSISCGRVRSKDGAIIGHEAVEFINQFKVDFGIIGISGIDEQGWLLDFDYREVNVARAIIANSRKVFLAADHTKFGRNAMVRVAHISKVDVFFTDKQLPSQIRNLFLDAGVAIYSAGTENVKTEGGDSPSKLANLL